MNCSNITEHCHNWAGLLLPEILLIQFTQSTAVLHKYLNDELKIPCLLQFFPEVAQNSPRIPRVFHVQRNPRVFQVCGHPVVGVFTGQQQCQISEPQ